MGTHINQWQIGLPLFSSQSSGGPYCCQYSIRTSRAASEIDSCARCSGQLKIIASIEEPEVIARILVHLERSAPGQHQAELPLGARAPPGQAGLL